MQKRILENLILENEDYIFGGNLIITGNVNIKNGSLIVSGKLTFYGLNCVISISGGDLAAEEIDSYSQIKIRGGDIFTKNLIAIDIDSDQNIYVNSANVRDILCFNYFVSGNNHSYHILAMQDVYILGFLQSLSLYGREVFIGKNVSPSCNIFAKYLEQEEK